MLADLAPPAPPAPRSTLAARVALGVEIALGVGSLGFGIYRLGVARNVRDRAIDVQAISAGLLSLTLAYYHAGGIK
jgi:hypothetical protein